MRTDIKIHSTKVSISCAESTSVDEAWNLWTFAVREKNKERKQLFEIREKLLLEYGNQSRMSNDVQELKELIANAKGYKDIIYSSEDWNQKELVCSDNLGNKLYLENFEVKNHEKRIEQINSLINTIETKIELLKPENQEPKQTEIKPFIDYLQNCDKVKLMKMLHELLDNAKTKDFARFMIALKELNYLHIPSPRNHLFQAMRDRFKNIGSDSGMNGYFADNGSEKLKINLSEIEETKQLIEKGLKD